jgi:hypothetical protein
LGVLHLPVTTDVLLLYPGVSLQEQIGLWAMRHPQQRVEASSWWSDHDLAALLRYARMALVDATEDPARARAVFLRAVARLGAGAVAMYAETTRDALEVFVRMRGSLFLLGPLFDEQWEEYFSHPRPARQATPVAPTPVRQRLRLAGLLDRRERQHAWWGNCVRASLNWPGTEMN